MSRFYHPDSFDSYMCLRPTFLMKVAMIFAIRHIAMILLAYSPVMQGDDFAFLKGSVSPLDVAADLPGLLLLIAWVRRHPGAHKLWRWAWRNGRLLITIAIAMNLVLLAASDIGNLISAYFWGPREVVTVVSIFLDLSVLFYLWRATMVPEVFAEFPAPAGENKSTK